MNEPSAQKAFAVGLFDPSQRREITLPAGSTIDEIVAASLPGLPLEHRQYVRVTIGDAVVPIEEWGQRPPFGSPPVVVKLIPGNATLLRAALTVSVTLAALTLAPPLGAALAGSALGTALGLTAAMGQGFAGGALLTVGGFLVNALVPPRRDKGGGSADLPSFSISGMQNPLAPNAPIPCVLGRHRYAPPYAARPYTETDGINHYIRAAFTFGYGELAISYERIGDTPISQFIGVDKETFAGVVSDGLMTKYPEQVIQESQNIELTFYRQNYIAPDSRFTAAGAHGFSIDVAFPSGLIAYWTDGNGRTHQQAQGISIRVRRRLETSNDWELIEDWPIVNMTTRPFTASRRYVNPTQDRYEIEARRIQPDYDDANQAEADFKINSRTFWTALRTYRNRYPLNPPAPLALANMRIWATGQLNGNLDKYNAIVQRVCLDWDSGTQTWVSRATSNPASLWRYVLQHPRNFEQVTDEKIDLAKIQYWHERCEELGLEYNRVHDFSQSLMETLDDIAAVGRASTLDAGDKWTVVIDEAQTVIMAHISPRNSWGFSARRKYIKPPDAMRVRFLDETSKYGYAEAERVIPWPGFVGTPRVIEAMDHPGNTNPASIWKETRRRQYEIIHRPDEYYVMMDIEALNVRRGDMVLLSHDVLERRQVSGRVRAVNGAAVTLDTIVEMVAGQTYAAIFRANATVENTPDSSVMRSVETVAGETDTLFLTGAGPAPSVGDLAFFGPSASVAFEAIVLHIESADDFTRRLTLVDHAPQIFELADAEVPPAWNGLTGDEIGSPSAAPAVPVLGTILSGLEVSPDPPVTVFVPISVGSGGGQTAYFQIQHRLVGAPSWTTVTLLAGSPGATITGYANDDQIEVRARAAGYGPSPLYSAYTSIVTHTVGANDPVPISLVSFDAEELANGTWRFDWALNESVPGTGIRIRYRAGVWDAWADLTPLTTGLVTESPWFSGAPVVGSEEVFTFGAVAIDVNGDESGAPIIIYASTHNWVPSLNNVNPFNVIEHLSGWI